MVNATFTSDSILHLSTAQSRLILLVWVGPVMRRWQLGEHDLASEDCVLVFNLVVS